MTMSRTHTVVGKLRKRGLLTLLDKKLRGNNGRPADIYAGWKPRHIEHEIDTTDICIALFDHAVTFVRGDDVNSWLPDAVLSYGNVTLNIELERETRRSTKAILKRFAKLKDCPYPLMFVCKTQNGISRLLKQAHDNMFFTTLDNLIACEWDTEWQTTGEIYTLEKPR